jgi:hypothetical protein
MWSINPITNLSRVLVTIDGVSIVTKTRDNALVKFDMRCLSIMLVGLFDL